MDDWVMVPRKITREMAKAMEQSDCGPDHPIEAFWQPSWEAALAAAPQQAGPVPFEAAWKLMEQRGYQYGLHETENVRLGYELALEANSVRITSAQVEQIKRLADEYAQSYIENGSALMELAPQMYDNMCDERDEARAALHAALDALTKGTP